MWRCRGNGGHFVPVMTAAPPLPGARRTAGPPQAAGSREITTITGDDGTQAHPR